MMYSLLVSFFFFLKDDAQKSTMAHSRTKATCLPDPVEMWPFSNTQTYFLVCQHNPD
jgi:hypothetical protein